MLGFSPLATVPLASDTASQLVYVTGQAFSSSQNSVSFTADAGALLTGQTVTVSQNNFSITADSVYLLLKQVDMVMSVSSVDLGVYINLDITGQEITSTLNSVEAYPITYVNLTAQSPLVLTQHGTYEAVAFHAPSQTIHTTLKSMRMWNKINTAQLANWTPINTTQSPGWTDIET